ncbi:hypothetical protein CONLIGDRAFT_75540 [Coniochaeta ligniaria NRRL 30616]|uniref:Uncharacterized protein n=1 Tax=Coniochaeta ligniaria NRRL 30616 TaxID=1408157 RepID=A0A1J7IUX5_9PEZI|nr:hypothetical protein CONLIGDRAFT_75540 [Coniochaeta ligniaria NRRL 30616]
MDPLSIASGCAGIMGAIVKTSSTIREFVRDVREARGQLSTTAQQLTELEMTISLIKDDHDAESGSFAEHMPDSVTKQTATVIQSCRDVLGELDTVMDKYHPRKHRTPLKWAFKGKDEVAALNKQLEAHSRTLQMSLEISTLIISKSIKTDTVALGVVSGQIKDDTGHIRDDTGKILQEIDELRGLVSQQLPDHVRARIDIMENYLDSLTEYAETVIDSVDRDNSPHGYDTPVSLSPRPVADEDPFRDDCRNGPSSLPVDETSMPSPMQGAVHEGLLPCEVVNPGSPVSLVLLGPTNSHKTSLVNLLNRLATNYRRAVDISNVSKFGVEAHDLEIPLSDYVLVDTATGAEIGDTLGLREWTCSPLGSKSSVRLRNPDAVRLNIRLVDTPGFTNNIIRGGLRGTDPKIMELVLKSLAAHSNDDWEKRLFAVTFFHSTGSSNQTPFRTSSKNTLNFYQRSMPALLSSIKIARVESFGKLFPLSEDPEQTVLEPPYFFIDSRLRMSDTYAQLVSYNEAYRFLLFLAQSGPKPLLKDYPGP